MTTNLRGNALAQEALKYIKDHPENWSQAEFFCGSSMCFGGTVIYLALGINDYDYKNTEVLCDFTPSSVARVLLGWNTSEAAYVFYNMTDNFNTLENLVNDVAEGIVKQVESVLRIDPEDFNKIFVATQPVEA